MKFGDYLKQRRAALEWTQPEAAAKAGIEQSYLSKLETGKSIPSADVYARLVAAYGLDTKAMVGLLYPAELDRLREIGEVRGTLLREARDMRSVERGWLVAGLVLLALGGGLIGLSRTDDSPAVTQFTYQSTGIVRAGESLDVFEGLDDDPAPDVPDYAARVARREALLRRVDDRTRSLPTLRGPAFIETVAGGRRLWRLVGSSEVRQPRRFDWAGPASWASLFAALGCFFISWRWPRRAAR